MSRKRARPGTTAYVRSCCCVRMSPVRSSAGVRLSPPLLGSALGSSALWSLFIRPDPSRLLPGKRGSIQCLANWASLGPTHTNE